MCSIRTLILSPLPPSPVSHIFSSMKGLSDRKNFALLARKNYITFVPGWMPFVESIASLELDNNYIEYIPNKLFSRDAFERM